MSRRTFRRITRFKLQGMLVCGMWLLLAGWVQAQAPVAPMSLPDGWDSLPVDQFVTTIQKFQNPVTSRLQGLAQPDEDAVRTRAGKLVAGLNCADPKQDLQVVLTLLQVAEDFASKTDRARLKDALSQRQDDWTGRAWQDVRAKCQLMARLRIARDLQVQEARRWLQVGGQRDQIPAQDVPTAWRMFTDGNSITRSFTVHWAGQVTVPQGGDWVFSISPINVNSQDQEYPMTVNETLTVAQTPVLSANATQWTSRGTPVTLTAGQAVPVQLDLAVVCPTKLAQNAVHAQLYWEGPGTPRQIVPATAVTQPDGTAAGFRATYSWTSKGMPQTQTRIDPVIDFAWADTPIWLPSDAQPALPQPSPPPGEWAGFRSVLTADYLASLENSAGAAQTHPFFPQARETASLLSSAQRQAFLAALAQHPNLLVPLSPKRFWVFFGAFRFGAPDEALELFGQWAERSADMPCDFPTPAGDVFDQEARNGYRHLSVAVTQEMPGQWNALQQNHLQRADGTCCLPVAYTLTYSALGRNGIGQWIGFLDSKLQDPALKGDLRVNWLLARAHAEEVRLGEPDPYKIAAPRIADSRAMLDEAQRTAATPPVKLRVARELAGRLGSLQKFDEARQVLTDVATQLPSDLAAAIPALKKQIDGVQGAEDAQAQTEKAAVKQNYLKSLQTRRDQAAAANDTDAVQRYDRLINAANNP